MAKRAVLVGCNYPGTDFELGGSVNDVQEVKEMLIDVYGFKEEHIKVCVDVKGAFKKSTFPTGKNIKKALKEMLNKTSKGDSLVFHFSGHGGVIPSDDETCGDSESLQSFLLPTDLNILTSEDFKRILAKFPLSEGARFTVITDASQSDGLLEGHDVINTNIPARTLLRRVGEDVKQEGKESNAENTGEATATSEGAAVSNSDATSAPGIESAADKKTAPSGSKEPAAAVAAGPAGVVAKEAPDAAVPKGLTSAVTEKSEPASSAVTKEPAANSCVASVEDSGHDADAKVGTEEEAAVKKEATESSEADAGDKVKGSDAAAPEKPKVTGPQSRQIALDTFLDALSYKAKKKTAKGNIRKSLHELFGDSSSGMVKDHVRKLKRQKSGPIHRRGLSALMEIFACGATDSHQGKAKQAAAKGPAASDVDESKATGLDAAEELPQTQVILLTAARRDQEVHDQGEYGIFTHTLVEVVKQHKNDGTLDNLTNFCLISSVGEIMIKKFNAVQNPGLESSSENTGIPFIANVTKPEEPKVAEGEVENKKADAVLEAAGWAVVESKNEEDGKGNKSESSGSDKEEDGTDKGSKPAEDEVAKTSAATGK